MKFNLTTSDLKKITEATAGVISSNTVLPILEDFLFSCKDRKLYVTATDLETSIQTFINVDHDEDGMIAIPAKMLINFLKSLPDSTLHFETGDDNSIKIKADTGKYKLVGESGNDFPRIPVVDTDHRIDLTGSAFLRIIKKSLFAIGNDELRPAMTGMFMNQHEGIIDFVCTDAHKLAHTIFTPSTVGQPFSFIVPKKALQLLSSHIPNDENNILIQYNEKQAFFSFGSYTLICRLVDARFPDFKSVIPVNPAHHVIINTNDILNTLHRINIFSNRSTNQISLTFTKNNVAAEAEDLDFSTEATENLVCQYSGEEITLSFNGRWLADVISSLGTPEIKIMFDAPNRATTINPMPQLPAEETLMLIMPIMINS